MAAQLKVSIGQYSDKGRKPANQDFHGVRIPDEPLLSLKGICVALADGISSSDVSQVASQAAVDGFLQDYYCTSQAWSVKTSAERVLSATNSWLYSQTQGSQFRYDKDKGYVCTFSALVLKSTTAHVFHAGDARIYRLQGDQLERLTEDHRIWLSQEKSYLSRALGVTARLDIDYSALPIEVGSVFVCATDGVYEHVTEQLVVEALAEHGADLDRAAESIAKSAYASGSPDNLTIQIVRIEELAAPSAGELVQELSTLPLPPALEAGKQFDGYLIARELYASQRSHVYLAVDQETGTKVVLKTMAVDVRNDEAYVERFLIEEWVVRRINSQHVVKPCVQTRKRNFAYLVTEYIEGQTLRQWMIDHPAPSVEAARGIIEQIARGVLAIHRLDMLHQDLRPENIMIDSAGTVKIIDFGSVHIAGIAEIETPIQQPSILGTEQYTAPEYFLGEAGSSRSDLFSLGVIAYEMLSGRLPYGTRVSSCRTKDAQLGLAYTSVLDPAREIPAWIDAAIRKAVHPNPDHRYAELSELVCDLRHPSRAFLSKTRAPLIERNPAAFWKMISAILALIILLLLWRLRP
jgi:serine/threonine protein phosphatase PrpC/predicted Ser/Thr protein kinase